MMNPVQISVKQPDGGERLVIIQPIIQRGGESGLASTGVYKTFNNSAGDEDHLLNETLYLSDIVDDPSAYDTDPNYLGEFQLNDNSWEYRGTLLDTSEQKQITDKISSYNDAEY